MAKKTFGEMFVDVVDEVGLTNTFADGTTETRRIKRDINQIQKRVLSISKTYLKKAGILISGGTVATQANYTIPTTVDKVTSIMITNSDVNYYPDQISITEFHRLDNLNGSGDVPLYWTIDKNELFIYPTPDTSSLPIELNAGEIATDLNTDPSATTDQTTDLQIKESYEDTIFYYALERAFFRLEDFASSDRSKVDFKEMMKDYKDEVSNPGNSVVVGGRDKRRVHRDYYSILTN